MRVCRRRSSSVAFLAVPFALTLLALTAAVGQGSYQAQVRGLVTDQSGAVVVNASVTITNDATNIAQTARTDEKGQYFFTGLRPATYTIKVQFSGFRVSEKTNVVLQVDQQTSVDFVLHPPSVSESVEVTQTAPLLDTKKRHTGLGNQQSVREGTSADEPQLFRTDLSGRGRHGGDWSEHIG